MENNLITMSKVSPTYDINITINIDNQISVYLQSLLIQVPPPDGNSKVLHLSRNYSLSRALLPASEVKSLPILSEKFKLSPQKTSQWGRCYIIIIFQMRDWDLGKFNSLSQYLGELWLQFSTLSLSSTPLHGWDAQCLFFVCSWTGPEKPDLESWLEHWKLTIHHQHLQ